MDTGHDHRSMPIGPACTLRGAIRIRLVPDLLLFAHRPGTRSDRARALIAIDAGKPVGMISPLLHGQFLEYMFQCIRGLHAELTRNRSFEKAPDAIGLPLPQGGEHEPPAAARDDDHTERSPDRLQARVETIGSTRPGAYNHFASPDAGSIRSSLVKAGDRFTLELPPASVSVINLDVLQQAAAAPFGPPATPATLAP